MQECVVHIKLMKMPASYGGNTQEDADGGELGNWSKSFPIIKPLNLTVAFSNETSFVAFNTAVRFKLHLIDPFATDGMFVRW